MLFTSKKPHYEYLRKKWGGRHREITDKLLENHGRHFRNITLGGLGGLMLLSSPGVNATLHPGDIAATHDGIGKTVDKNSLLAASLKGVVPEEVRKLSDTEDKEISEILSETMKIKVEPELEGIRLNRTYGMIGGEQHLYRFPGDTLYRHAENSSDWAMYGSSGIAPGLGAWGYFASSEAAFSEKDKERERYYLAVQTFLSPGFAENVGKYRDFFKFRKMLVVNPKTGQAVVAVIGDAGPAAWTGKHLGGSPEVMHFVGLASGPRKGAVLYYFIDDPEDKIPLGPVAGSASYAENGTERIIS